MTRLVSILSALLLFCACGTKASFETSEKINGRDPKAAVHSIFGATIIEADEGQVSAVIHVASDDSQLCNTLEKYPDGLHGYLDALGEGEIDATLVITLFAKVGDYPKAGDTFSGHSEHYILINLFGSSENQELRVFAIDARDGRITFDAFSKGREKEVPTLSGSISTDLIFDLVSEEEIEVGMVGSFQRSKYCQSLDHFFDEDGIKALIPGGLLSAI